METSSISFCRSCHNGNSQQSTVKAGILAHLMISSSEDEETSGKDDGDLVEILRNAMTSYSTFLTEHAQMTKA